MFKQLSDWLDHRFGYRKIIDALLLEHIPGGARWRYVWGSTLAFVFAIQVVTGVLLMTSYSPSDSTAWGSVYFIQYRMEFGWFLRGLHHFGSGTMVVLLGLHMLQVVIAGAHLPPRELNWWLGLALMGLVLGMSLTGYLLPWDQKGYWATQVATNIAGNLPVLGPFIQKVVVGGPAYGHHTLTHFFALHVGILPPLIVILLVAHIYIFRRHGVTYPGYVFKKDQPHHAAPKEGGGWFWPDQAFRDMVASLAIFAFLIVLVMWGHGHAIETPEQAAEQSFWQRWAFAGRAGYGANLDAPADPSQAYPARPEWYFLFLFQLLKYFEGDQEIVGTVVIPTLVGLMLAILPLLGFGRTRKLGHVLGVLVVVGILTGAAVLTMRALADDIADPAGHWLVTRLGLWAMPAIGGTLLLTLGMTAVLPRGIFRGLISFLGSLTLAVLAVGAGFLLWYAQAGQHVPGPIARLLGPELSTRVEDSVNQWVADHMTDEDRKTRDGAVKFHQELKKAEVAGGRAIELAGEGIPAEGAVMLLRRDPKTRGLELFQQNCAGCHNFGKDAHNDKATAADLDGFGTEDWVFRLLSDPGHQDFFGRTKLTKMAEWVRDNTPEKDDLRTLAKWLSSAPSNASPDRAEGWFKAGVEKFESVGCKTCHSYEGKGGKQGPDLTGYGSADWVRLMVMAPNHPTRYGNRNTMPAFRQLEGPGGDVVKLEWERQKQLLLDAAGEDEKKQKAVADASKLLNLSDIDRELIIRWLVRDYRVVFGGELITGPPRRE